MEPLFSTRQVCVFIRKRIYQRNKGYLVLSSHLIITVLVPFIHFESKKALGCIFYAVHLLENQVNYIFKLQWMIYLESKFHWNKWHLFYTDSSFSLQSTHYNEGKCFQTKNDLQLVQIHVAVIKKPILCIVLSKVYVSVRPLIIESTATNFSLFTNSQYFNIIVWTSSHFIRISSSSCVKKIMQSWKRYVL